MKYCPNCSAEIDDDSAFCTMCGARCSDQQLPKTGKPTWPKLKTNRGLLKFILLSLITFGIYGIVAISTVSTDINIIATRYDGKKTMHYCWIFFLLSPITLGIAGIVWIHKLSNRIGKELKRRNISYNFSAASFWGWSVLGALILVGPFIYVHKFFKSMNLLAADYNAVG